MRKLLQLSMVVALTLSISFCPAVAAEATVGISGDAANANMAVAPYDESVAPQGDLGYYTTKILVSTTYKKMVFAKYLTADWKKTDHYDINEGTSFGFNFGYAYEGVNLGVSFERSYDYTSTVYADVTRWSKLAAFADFTIKKYLVKRYTTGGMLVDTYYSYTTTTTATYVAARYQ